ncbi:MAG TPA: oxidoreductase [Vicinamibacterales bacterium]|nr:oxidoreductase [Vicinamibacterales bacterium]
MGSLQRKVALVTGSVSGIGRGIAEHFASLGARIVVHGPDEGPARNVAAALRDAGHETAAIAGDLVSPKVCRGIVRFAVETFGRIDVLVNNAGITTRGSLVDSSLELWDTMMAVNVRAPFLCLQEAAASMKRTGGGVIVNIGSINAYVGLPNLGPYSVSKGALMTMTRNAALALGEHRIRVNQINVGWTLTDNEDRVQQAEGRGPGWLAEAVKTRAFGRLLTPEDVARAAAYLATDDSAVVTGTVIDLEQFPIGALPGW